MKALVVSPQPFFSARGTPYSVYYRALVMSELGVEIDLLTYGQGEDIAVPGIRVIRIPRFGFRSVRTGPSLLKAFLDVFLFAWTIAVLCRRRYDFVHAHEESVFFCRLLKPIFRFQLVYDMHSSLPQQLTNFAFTRSRAIIGLFHWLERSCLKASDAVITICPDLADYARARMPDEDRHFLIENSVFDEIRLATPAMDHSSQTSRRLAGREVVAYVGSFERYQGLDLLLEAFQQVARQSPDALLLLVGGTEKQVERVRRDAHAAQLDGNCLVVGRVDFATAKKLVAMARVQVSPRAGGTATPLKIYQQLASGVPLVATQVRSHTQVVDDEVCCLVAPESDELAAGILTCLSDSQQAAAWADAARRLYEEKYSRGVYEEKCRALLQTLNGFPGPPEERIQERLPVVAE